jgi:co-chaperonin GroES (HSP10)
MGQCNGMRAIGKYIVITPIEEEIKTKSGLILSGDDANQFRYKKGVVVQPGTEVPHIKAGDVIYYDKAHGFTMIIQETQYSVIQERDVVVVE